MRTNEYITLFGRQIDIRIPVFLCALVLGYVFVEGLIKGKVGGLGYVKVYERKDDPFMYWSTVAFYGVVSLGMLGALLFQIIGKILGR